MVLGELVRELARARKDAAEAKVLVDQRRRELHDTEKYHRLTDAVALYDQAQDVAGNLGTAVREAAVATGEKRPHPAVEVKTYTVVAIEDEPRVIQWASQDAPRSEPPPEPPPPSDEEFAQQAKEAMPQAEVKVVPRNEALDNEMDAFLKEELGLAESGKRDKKLWGIWEAGERTRERLDKAKAQLRENINV